MVGMIDLRRLIRARYHFFAVRYVIWITAPLNASIVTISSQGVAGGYWPVPPSVVKFENRSGLFSKTHNFTEINVLLFQRLEQEREQPTL
jgi:hypothetical protein